MLVLVLAFVLASCPRISGARLDTGSNQAVALTLLILHPYPTVEADHRKVQPVLKPHQAIEAVDQEDATTTSVYRPGGGGLSCRG